jgi:hypothetical protein
MAAASTMTFALDGPHSSDEPILCEIGTASAPRYGWPRTASEAQLR